jgi:hypothetical protein
LAKPEAVVVPIERRRLDHARRKFALDVAAGRIGERAFLAAIRRLTEEEDRTADLKPARRSVDAAKAMDYIRNFASSWAKAKPPTKATMIQSLCEEIIVGGAKFASVRLTPEAYAHGLALALPQEVLVPPIRTRGTALRTQVQAQAAAVPHGAAREDAEDCCQPGYGFLNRHGQQQGEGRSDRALSRRCLAGIELREWPGDRVVEGPAEARSRSTS